MTHTLKEVWEKYAQEAREKFPEGSICTFCGGENNFADDCGWFYIHPQGSEGFCCEDCWNGAPGEAHRKKHGVGDR